MKLYIKNMVCNRCIMVVRQLLDKMNLTVVHVEMGEIQLLSISPKQQVELNDKLQQVGFEILNDKKRTQIEQVKKFLTAIVHKNEIGEHFSISTFLSKKLNKEYSNISRLFSEVEGITVEQFFILQKIEKTKELLKYDELSLSEIAWKLGYSSVAHLSAQFKKMTGFTPGEFKKMGSRTLSR